jgi:hypothetical protein
MEDEKDIIRDMLGGIDCEITEAEDVEQALAAIATHAPNQGQSRVAIDPRHRHHLTCAGWGRICSASSGMQ